MDSLHSTFSGSHPIHPTRCLTLLSCIVFLLLLSGCATHNVNNAIHVKDTLYSAQDPFSGLMILTVTNALPQVKKFDQLEVKLINGKSFPAPVYRIHNTDLSSSQSTSLFIADLPPGDYKATRLYAHTGANFIYSELNYGSDGFSFRIESSEVTSLDRLVAVPNDFGSALIVRDHSHAHNAKLLNKLFPDFMRGRSKLDFNRALNWISPALSERSAAILHTARQLTQELNDLQPVQNVLAAGSQLGQIVVRLPSEKWVSINSGLPYTLNSFVETPDGRMIFGGELNTLFYTQNKQIIQIDTDSMPNGKIIAVDWIADKGLVIVLAHDQAMEVYASQSLKPVSWRKITELHGKAWLFHKGKVLFQKQGHRYYFAVSPDELLIYDLTAGQWQEQQFPVNVDDFAVSPDHIVSVKGSTLGTRQYISLDAGETWSEANIRSSDSLIQYDAEGQAFVLSADSGGVLKVSDDHGQNWYQVASAPQGNLRIVGNLIFVEATDSRLGKGTVLHGLHRASRQWKMERNTSLADFLASLRNKDSP